MLACVPGIGDAGAAALVSTRAQRGAAADQSDWSWVVTVLGAATLVAAFEADYTTPGPPYAVIEPVPSVLDDAATTSTRASRETTSGPSRRTTSWPGSST